MDVVAHLGGWILELVRGYRAGMGPYRAGNTVDWAALTTPLAWIAVRLTHRGRSGSALRPAETAG